MLKKSFCHIQGVSPQKELLLWQFGIHSWEDFFKRENDLAMNFPKHQLMNISEELLKSLNAIEMGDYDLFKSMPRNQHWRVYDHLKHKACFLDIETTGLSKQRHDITLVGIHSADGTKIFMKDKNLDDFKDELEKYDVIVTFNGSCFDLPFLKHKFPNLNLNQFHLDLRFLMARLGYRGGLKSIEIERGITRSDDLEGVSGYEAVILWYKYKKGDLDALKKLEKYLIADVENLKILMDFTYLELKKELFYKLSDISKS